MNNDPEDDFEDLENELKRLIPSSMDDDLLGRLEADQKQIEAGSSGKPTRRWPMILAITVCTALLLTNVLHLTGVFDGTADLEAAANEIEPGELDSLVSGSRANQSIPRFQPISSEGYLIDTSSGKVIQSESGDLQRQLTLDFQDVDHWHDPSTSTNIQIISPRRELIQVPLRTD